MFRWAFPDKADVGDTCNIHVQVDQQGSIILPASAMK